MPKRKSPFENFGEAKSLAACFEKDVLVSGNLCPMGTQPGLAEDSIVAGASLKLFTSASLSYRMMLAFTLVGLLGQKKTQCIL